MSGRDEPEDLAHWPDDELWLVELEEPVVPQPFHLAAARGRDEPGPPGLVARAHA